MRENNVIMLHFKMIYIAHNQRIWVKHTKTNICFTDFMQRYLQVL